MNINNFAVMTLKGNPLLCLVQDGYFASTAWRISQEDFSKVMGSSFGIITADDNMEYKEDKYKFRLPNNETEVLNLLSSVNCCDSFINRVKPLLNEEEITTLNMLLDLRNESEEKTDMEESIISHIKMYEKLLENTNLSVEERVKYTLLIKEANDDLNEYRQMARSLFTD